ncbi:MAG: hypothetical protein F4X09_13300 [Gammaproteobacteria bacterium]|nr:hypothetical protein [Gammaproteobacteria bacterium]MXX06892.1 hypothetical protein [Gammaproteobacteria bacterium]MYA67576.1 hypothetical protein [Gammaproteobacteria bacterium]MYC61151.1 hypothetical protein [Gammaproteobacteria bacterium]MYE29066.1 hypothetical protein [Gammaproteobacteria bacterium]
MNEMGKQPVPVVISAPVPRHWINPQQKAMYAAGFHAGFWFASCAIEYSVDFEADDVLERAEDMLMTKDGKWEAGFSAGVKDCFKNRYD